MRCGGGYLVDLASSKSTGQRLDSPHQLVRLGMERAGVEPVFLLADVHAAEVRVLGTGLCGGVARGISGLTPLDHPITLAGPLVVEQAENPIGGRHQPGALSGGFEQQQMVKHLLVGPQESRPADDLIDASLGQETARHHKVDYFEALIDVDRSLEWRRRRPVNLDIRGICGYGSRLDDGLVHGLLELGLSPTDLDPPDPVYQVPDLVLEQNDCNHDNQRPEQARDERQPVGEDRVMSKYQRDNKLP